MLLGASRVTRLLLASRQHPHDRQHAAAGILLGASRLTRLLLASRQHPHDRQHAAAGGLLGASRVTLAVRPVWCPSQHCPDEAVQAEMSECNGGAFGRNFRDYGSTYSSRSRCDCRSAWGSLGTLLPFGFEFSPSTFFVMIAHASVP